MARIIPIGQPVNDSEREAISLLRDRLPSGYTVIHNFELRQGSEHYEIDLAILGPHAIYVVDVKGTRGLIDVYGSKWYPEGRAPYHSPLAILRKHAKALKSILQDQDRTNSALRSIYVDAAVVLTAPDAKLVDAAGVDSPSVTYLSKAPSFFQDVKRLPSGFSTDIRALLSSIERTVTGKAKPRSTPPVYGNWRIEERLGGDDRYTEYRAKHVLLGERKGGTARLRVYQVDPYLPAPERKQQRDRISNAFRAVASLPGHPNILTVREFFATEAEDRFILVTEDVPGQVLRQHIKKATLSLTYDQKVSIVRDVLGALDHMHRSEPQVIHRNLSPDSILVSASGRGLLTSFDYARAGANRTSTIAPDIVDDLDVLYQAPECYRDPSKASVLSDIYSAGFVFYELLVGEPPFSSIDDMMDKDGKFPLKPSELKPELPQELDAWLQELCAFDSEDRLQSAAIAKERFDQIVGPDPRSLAKAKPPANVPKLTPARGIDYADLPKGFELSRRFLVEERLGRPGGFAVAYKVFDSLADKSRVLKLVVKDRRSPLERLKQEYKALLDLKPHPNVVSVVWADQLADETPFIVFEYLPGSNVEELIDEKSLSLDDTLRIARDTALGLEHLHKNGVFHRDIKPSNLLWTESGVRIIDFNVAVREDDPDPRQGGTRRYLPPDLQLGDSATPAEEADRDLYALGITLYECVTGGNYPWPDSVPPPSDAPRPLADHRSDVNPGFAALVEKIIAPRRAARFASVSQFLLELDKITSARRSSNLRSKASETFASSALAGTAKPNYNPFVVQLLSMYSQSALTNAGTRGLDDASRLTYIPTLLDRNLKSALLGGEFRLVIISGNAGDGKTAFIQKLEDEPEIQATIKRRTNGSDFSLKSRRFITNYDGSQDEDDTVNDKVLLSFFEPFRGSNDRSWPTSETRLIAINEGRLLDFLSQHQADFAKLAEIVRTGLAGGAPNTGVAIVNLNLRTLVADPSPAGTPDSIFDRLLRRMTHENLWAPCSSCDLRQKCYAYHNAQTFQDPVAGPKIAERLKTLYTITHLRGRLHVTMRDLRSALAFMLVGTRDCDEIHALYQSAGEDSAQRILDNFYFNSWKGGLGTSDRLLALLNEIDVAEVSNPDLDRSLDYLSPDAKEMTRYQFSERSSYDTALLGRLFEALPRDVSANAAEWRLAKHRQYVSMVRRREYFERRDDGWREMLPYASAVEFWKLVSGQSPLPTVLDRVLLALNRGEGLSDPKRLGRTLALRVRNVDKGTLRSYRLFPGDRFELRLPSTARQDYIEHVPSSVSLAYRSPTGDIAELAINLEIFEMLTRLFAGYRPNPAELQGYYLSLSVFKNLLASAPYQEVLLTTSGYDFYQIRRDPTGTLHLEALQGEAGA